MRWFSSKESRAGETWVDRIIRRRPPTLDSLTFVTMFVCFDGVPDEIHGEPPRTYRFNVYCGLVERGLRHRGCSISARANWNHDPGDEDPRSP